jgi:hypothetical protein
VAALVLLSPAPSSAAAPSTGSPTKRACLTARSGGGGLGARAAAAAAPALAPLLAVANTHVLFNPKRGDIKIGQLRLLTAALARLARGGGGGGGAGGVLQGGSGGGGAPASGGPAPVGAALLMMGDLNTAPHSPVYEFLARGELDCLLHSRKDLSGAPLGGGRGPARRLAPAAACGGRAACAGGYTNRSWAAAGGAARAGNCAICACWHSTEAAGLFLWRHGLPGRPTAYPTRLVPRTPPPDRRHPA